MKSTVTDLGDDKVKLTVEVDESVVEEAVDAAFRELAREVRVKGFRPGKVPRRILEAQIGSGFARSEALKSAIPRQYGVALIEHDVDAIAPPEVDITSGETEGPVVFEATVPVRPTIEISGYDGVEVRVPSPVASDDEVAEEIDGLRSQFADLVDVSRPAVDGDHVLVDIHGSQDGEELAGLTADDYSYEVGSGGLVAELDENLRGAKAGDILAFDAAHPADDEILLDFRILVKAVRERRLPELTDQWVADSSDLATVDELRTDTAERITAGKRHQAGHVLRDRVADAVAALVEEDPPEALVAGTAQEGLQNMAMRLQSSGIDLDQWLAATGQSPEEMTVQLKEQATASVRIDLALRAVAAREGIEVASDDVDRALAETAEQVGETPTTVRERLTGYDGMLGLRADVLKAKALDWLVERATIIDEDTGEPLGLDQFEHALSTDDPDHHHDDDDTAPEEDDQ